MLGIQQKAKQGVTLATLNHLEIEPEIYDKTGRSVKDDAERGQSMKKVAGEVELAERLKMMGPGYEPLDKETALKHIKQIEMRKVQQIAGALIAAKMGKLPQNRMPMVQEMAKIQAIDSYNKESGIEDSDIVIAFNKLELGQTEEFRVIMQEAQQSLQATVSQTMQ